MRSDQDVADASRPEAGACRPLQVLVADDSAFGQAVGRRFLESLGCAVDVVAGGEAAVASACAHPYDIVFMDCQMPGVDGYEATRRIRRVPRLAGLPIIALTGETGPEARQRCLDAGATDYLPKPYAREALELLILGVAGTPCSATALEPIAPDQVVFRPVQVLDRFGGEIDIVCEVVARIEQDLPGFIAALRRAADNGDGPGLAGLARDISGSVEVVDAVRLSNLCAHIEAAARAADPSSAVTLAVQIEHASADLVAALRLWTHELMVCGDRQGNAGS